MNANLRQAINCCSACVYDSEFGCGSSIDGIVEEKKKKKMDPELAKFWLKVFGDSDD